MTPPNPTDAEIIRVLAEEAMGWHRSSGASGVAPISWDPLTRWSDAGMLVDKMRERGWCLDFHIDANEQIEAQVYYANFFRSIKEEYEMFSASGPRAISLAAYRAVKEGQ